MFEGHIKGTEFSERRETPILHQFRWTDLVARLAATRELRDELAKVEGGFNAFAEARRETEMEGKPSVNHDDLNHSKAAGLGPEEAASDAVRGDREKE